VPVSWDLVGLEHLLSELLVSTVLDSVDLESMRVTVDVMILGEHVRHWVGECSQGKSQPHNHLGISIFRIGDEEEVLRDIVSHLWGRRRSSIFVLDHTIMQLWGHSNDHVIVVWVEVSTFWDIKTEWWVVMVTSQKVVRVVDEPWVVGVGLSQIWRPDTQVCVLGLMDSHIWWPHSIVDSSLSPVPFLEIVALVLLMGWMNLWEKDHLVN